MRLPFRRLVIVRLLYNNNKINYTYIIYLKSTYYYYTRDRIGFCYLSKTGENHFFFRTLKPIHNIPSVDGIPTIYTRWCIIVFLFINIYFFFVGHISVAKYSSRSSSFQKKKNTFQNSWYTLYFRRRFTLSACIQQNEKR